MWITPYPMMMLILQTADIMLGAILAHLSEHADKCEGNF
jgi:hypothetical protein